MNEKRYERPSEILASMGWSQDAIGRDTSGEKCFLGDSNLESICTYGAMCLAFRSPEWLEDYNYLQEFTMALQKEIRAINAESGLSDSVAVGHYNDHPGRTKEECIALLRKTEAQFPWWDGSEAWPSPLGSVIRQYQEDCKRTD